MADGGIVRIDARELSQSAQRILQTVQDEYPREAQRLMQAAGNAYRGKLAKLYRAEVGTKTGNLRRGFKRGRAYLYKADNAYQVRVKNIAPHAPLIEHGHRIVTHAGRDTGKRVEGKHLVPRAQEAFEADFGALCERFVDKLLEKGFSG